MAREPSEKERFEVLLEQVRKELELVAEGYVALDQKIDRRIDELDQKFGMGLPELDQKIEHVARELSKKMDVGFTEVRAAVQTMVKELQEHVRAHAG